MLHAYWLKAQLPKPEAELQTEVTDLKQKINMIMERMIKEKTIVSSEE